MPLPLHHPLLGAHLPSLKDLVSVADIDAERALKVARELAICRFLVERSKRVETLDTEGPSSLMLTRTDVLRALLAIEPEFVRTQVLGDLPPSQEFTSECALWASLSLGDAKPQCLNTDPIPLHRAWARRWALAFLREKKIDLHSLLGSVLEQENLDRVATWSNDWFEGILAPGEFVRPALLNLRRGGAWPLPRIPPIYWDRHLGLHALESASETSPIVLVVGAVATGRKALLRAWCQRFSSNGQTIVVDDPSPKRSSFWGMLGPEPWNLEAVAATAANGVKSCFAFTHNVPDGVGGPAWMFAKDPWQQRTIRVLSILSDLSAKYPSQVQLALSLTTNEMSELTGLLPSYGRAAVIHVPDLKEEDILPIWMCQAPVEEETMGYTISLTGRLLALEGLDRHTLPWESWPIIESAHRPPPARTWTRAIHAAGRGTSTNFRAGSPEEAVFQKYVGSVERLADLAVLNKTLA